MGYSIMGTIGRFVIRREARGREFARDVSSHESHSPLGAEPEIEILYLPRLATIRQKVYLEHAGGQTRYRGSSVSCPYHDMGHP